MSPRALILTLFMFTSCGGADSHTLSANNYVRTCVDVIDCVPVYEGPVGCCGLAVTCPNAAIRSDQLPKYMSDADQASKCDVEPPCVPSPMCVGGRVACTNGACALLEPTDGGAD
ncbi:MAG TPA: hypothetical protein VK989_06935 [Polyangia bacterium]|jgi:hypothetical protein|nr:hypothetical protein [Polyangia bacterium]